MDILVRPCNRDIILATDVDATLQVIFLFTYPHALTLLILSYLLVYINSQRIYSRHETVYAKVEFVPIYEVGVGKISEQTISQGKRDRGDSHCA